MIGDTPRDYECAQAEVPIACWWRPAASRLDELGGLGADAVVADLAATEAVVDVLSAGL